MPQARTRTRTSSSPICGVGRSVTSSCRYSFRSSAFMLDSLRLRHELDAHRLRDLDRLPRGRQASRLQVDPEDRDVVRVLVRGQEVVAGGIDAEVARRLPARGLVAGRGEVAGLRIDGEDGDAVVTPVRAVQELAGGMDLDLRRRG